MCECLYVTFSLYACVFVSCRQPKCSEGEEDNDEGGREGRGLEREIEREEGRGVIRRSQQETKP